MLANAATRLRASLLAVCVLTAASLGFFFSAFNITHAHFSLARSSFHTDVAVKASEASLTAL